MSAALCDFEGEMIAAGTAGKYGTRLYSRAPGGYTMKLTAAEKLIGKIRAKRKDIFLIGFKTTADATAERQFRDALNLLKTTSCNLVFSNDVVARRNMIVTPEQARYFEGEGREAAIHGLVNMALSRARGTFTRSTVVDGVGVPWNDPQIPASLRTVVDHCRARGAYKPFLGATVGHFAVKVDDRHFVTSIRKSDFNKLDEVGMVLVASEDANSVVAYGAKPSVGGMSQRMIFRDHPDMDCIVHFHCPKRKWSSVNTVPQWKHECGSHQCGENTSLGLRKHKDANVKAVMLDNHGPNIVFSRDADPASVIDFIERNFDLTQSTDGVPR